MSATALSALLDGSQYEPFTASRREIRNARDAVVNQQTQYGTLFGEIECTASPSPMRFTVANLPALLCVAFSQCESWRDLIHRTLAAKPNTFDTPWHLIMYGDEVTPGNQLSPDNARKMWIFYVSFLELGPEVLSQEDAWFCLAALRSKRVCDVHAGVAQAFKMLVKHLFCNTQCSLQTTGVSLSPSTRIFCKLGMVLQDGGAQKLIWLVKGDAGTKCCMLCRNVIAMDSSLEDEEGVTLLRADVMRERDIDFATNDDIRGSVRRLAAHRATDSNADFKTCRGGCKCMPLRMSPPTNSETTPRRVEVIKGGGDEPLEGLWG